MQRWMLHHDGGRSRPAKTHPPSRAVIARRRPDDQMSVARPTSDTSDRPRRRLGRTTSRTARWRARRKDRTAGSEARWGNDRGPSGRTVLGVSFGWQGRPERRHGVATARCARRTRQHPTGHRPTPGPPTIELGERCCPLCLYEGVSVVVGRRIRERILLGTLP